MRTNLSQNKNSWSLLSDIIAFISLLAGIGSFNWELSHPPVEYIDESGTKKGVVHDIFEKPFSTKRGGNAILIVGVKLLEIKLS